MGAFIRMTMGLLLALVGTAAIGKPGLAGCDLHLEALRADGDGPYTFVYRVSNVGYAKCDATVRIPAADTFSARGFGSPIAQSSNCETDGEGRTARCASTLNVNESSTFVVTLERLPTGARFTCLDASAQSSQREITLANNVDVGCWSQPPVACPVGSGSDVETEG